MTPGLILVVAIALFALVTIAKGIRIVQQAQTMVIERLGKYHRTLDSGINLILPWLDKPRAIDWHAAVGDKGLVRHFRTEKIDMRETVYVFPSQNVITKDNVVVEIDALIYSQITDPVRASYEIANLPDAVKQSRILNAEGIRQSEINQAEGQKQARILEAEAEAAARLMVAEAEAKAIERITDAIKGTGGDPARYLIAIRYIEALREMVTSPQSNKVIYLPYEATGVLASLGGIREMFAAMPKSGER